MGKYIYCVADCVDNKHLGVQGVNGADAYLIPYKDISAAVSDVYFEELDPTDENLIAHEKVNQSIMFDHMHNVVPMTFCTIVKGEEDVAKILMEGYYTFKKNLSFLKNKFELGVKIFCDVEKYKSEYDEEMYKISEEVAEDIFKKINGISTDSRLNDLIIENMIMNASFLLEKDKLELFNQVIKEIDDKYGDKLLIRIVGPMAAYSFVKMSEESRL